MTGNGDAEQQALLDCAYSLSPNVENTAPGTVLVDISGTGLLFGSARELTARVCAEATRLGLMIRVAVSSDPDAAVHAARGFQENTFIPPGKETEFLASLPIRALCPALAALEDDRAHEMLETLEIWGIHNFGAFAALPDEGVFERLGVEGVLLQKLARGRTARLLGFHRPPPGYALSVDLEYPVELLEPLLFTVARLINRLCANLRSHSLAASHLLIRLSLAGVPDQEYPIRLAIPTQDHRLLLKLAEVEIQARLPGAPVCGVMVSCEPAKPRVSQKGLFASLAAEPQKLEMQLARLSKLAGKGNAGSAELLDTHRPQAFRITHFQPYAKPGRKRFETSRDTSLAVRIFRPPPRANVAMEGGRPKRISAGGTAARSAISGTVVAAAGPWRKSGDWWSGLAYSREEWDVELSNGSVWRIYLDRLADGWFIEGMYD